MPKTPTPILPANANPISIPISQNKENDTIPTYLYFVKAMQEGNTAAAAQAMKHAMDTHGPQMGTDLSFLAKRLQGSSLNDIARRTVATEANPELKRFYTTINENPDILNHFQYSMDGAEPPTAQTAAFKSVFSKK